MCSCWEWYKNAIWFLLAFVGLVYIVKFVYMINEGNFGDAGAIIESSKFWAWEEIFWGIGFTVALACVVFLLVFYILFMVLAHYCHRTSNEACHRYFPLFYESCCMTTLERMEYHNTLSNYQRLRGHEATHSL